VSEPRGSGAFTFGEKDKLTTTTNHSKPASPFGGQDEFSVSGGFSFDGAHEDLSKSNSVSRSNSFHPSFGTSSSTQSMFDNLSGSGSFGPNGPLSLSRSTSGISHEQHKSNYFDDNPLSLSHQSYQDSTDAKPRRDPAIMFPTRFPNSSGQSKFQPNLNPKPSPQNASVQPNKFSGANVIFGSDSEADLDTEETEEQTRSQSESDTEDNDPLDITKYVSKAPSSTARTPLYQTRTGPRVEFNPNPSNTKTPNFFIDKQSSTVGEPDEADEEDDYTPVQSAPVTQGRKIVTVRRTARK